jgi:hypothetical protein
MASYYGNEKLHVVCQEVKFSRIVITSHVYVVSAPNTSPVVAEHVLVSQRIFDD